MLKQWSRGFVMIIVMTVLTGIAYPLVMTGLAQLLFSHQANGSLLYKNGQVVGSKLIGQNFSDPRYFHPRPSAAGQNGYDAASSGGSNLGPTNDALMKQVSQRVDTVRSENGLLGNQTVPSDLVTASASGLDPDITPEAAMIQVPRIAKERGLSEAAVRDLVQRNMSSRELGVLGEPRINVLQLNMGLDSLK